MKNDNPLFAISYPLLGEILLVLAPIMSGVDKSISLIDVLHRETVFLPNIHLEILAVPNPGRPSRVFVLYNN